MKLFDTYTIKNKTIPNRIVMPPMVCFNYSSDGIISKKHIEHYVERAKGGVGLIIVEATAVSSEGRLHSSQLCFKEENRELFSELTSRVKECGSKILIQIHHAGYRKPQSLPGETLCSIDYEDEKIKAKAMSKEDIARVTLDFIKASMFAEECGFDGVEIHGAHTYLLNQFASVFNTRTDEYGGSLDNKLRFSKEVIEGIKNHVSDDFIVSYRLGANEPDIKTGTEIALKLESYGLDMINISTGIGIKEKPVAPDDFKLHWIPYMGAKIGENLKIPTIVVFGIDDREKAEYILSFKGVDFVAVGKGLLADPNWPNKYKANDDDSVNICYHCARCSYYDDGNSCPAQS